MNPTMLFRMTVAGALVTVIGARAAAAVRFDAKVLHNPAGTNTEALALNDYGEVTGRAGTNSSSNPNRAFFWAPGGDVQIVDDSAYSLSTGTVINNAGQIAGTGSYCPPVNGACTSTVFRYTPGVGIVDVGSLGGSSGTVHDMNEGGTVVGYWRTGADPIESHAFAYRDGEGMLDLGVLDSWLSTAFDICDAGTIVGRSWNGSDYRAVCWDSGPIQDLGTLGGDASTALCVTDNGTIAGSAEDPNGVTQGFIRPPGGPMQAAPAPAGATTSQVAWLADSGGFVGSYQIGDGPILLYMYAPEHGIIEIGPPATVSTAWTGFIGANDAGAVILQDLDDVFYFGIPDYFDLETPRTNLNDLIVQPLDFDLEFVNDINQRGQVITQGRDPATFITQSVLLTPIVEGDMNCDGSVDFGDINGFVAALTTPVTFEADNPNCPLLNADVNEDGDVGFGDINAFVAMLLN